MPFAPFLPYIAIGLVAIGGLTWLRSEWVAPYKAAIAGYEATITKMKKASEDREKIEGEDRRRAEANAAKAEELQSELDRIIKDTQPDACKLSASELERLRNLAGDSKRANRNKPQVSSRTK